MRLAQVSLASTGSVVMPLDPHITNMQSAIAMYASQDVSAITSQVDGTISDLNNNIVSTVSRTTTVITITFSTPHQLGGTNDYVIISGTGNSSLDGTYPVASVTSPTVVTVTSGSSGTIAATQGKVVPLRTLVAVIASASASATTPAVPAVTTTSNPLNWIPFSALILKATAWTAGTVYLNVRQSGIV